MKVYMWVGEEGVYLINEKRTMWARPYFISHPQRTNLLKERYDPTLMDKTDLLITVTDEELQQLVDNAVIHWKIMLDYIEAGLFKVIAEAEIRN